jgi:hypothetical protein
MPHLQRINSDRLGDVLELSWAEIGHFEIEPPLDLAVRRLIARMWYSSSPAIRVPPAWA